MRELENTSKINKAGGRNEQGFGNWSNFVSISKHAKNR